MTDIDKKIAETIRSNKCERKGCLSKNQDNLQVVWFGNKFDNKDITCSSCVLMNDTVVGRLEPVAENILPVSAFAQKFSEEYNQYIKLKNSKDWRPKLTEAKKQQIKKGTENFEKVLNNTLKNLVESLQKFLAKVVAKSNQIFMDKMNNEDNFTRMFTQISALMNRLHKVGQDAYRFSDQGEVKLKNEKLRKTINQVTGMVQQTLNGLMKQLRTRTEQIQKI